MCNDNEMKYPIDSSSLILNNLSVLLFTLQFNALLHALTAMMKKGVFTLLPLI